MTIAIVFLVIATFVVIALAHAHFGRREPWDRT